jgi:kynureninase
MNSFSKVNGKKSIYFGNSLGLQPKERKHVDEVMDDWANLAFEGHFMLKNWWDYHERLAKPLGKIMGHCHLKLL